MAFAVEGFGSMPVLDVSLESLSENLKEGATRLKEKVVEFLARFVEWVKTIVQSKERALAAGKAQVAREAEQAKLVLQTAKTLALPYDAFSDVSEVWELFGVTDIEAPARFIYEYNAIFDQAEWSYNALHQVVASLLKAFEQDDPGAGYAAVQSYREQVEKRTEEIKQLAENKTHQEQNLVQLLKARPSLETIEKAVNALVGFQNELLTRATQVNRSDSTDKALTNLGDFVTRHAATAHIRFLEGARDIGSIQSRFGKLVTQRYGWYVEHLFQRLPSARGVQAMARVNKKYAEGADGDEAFATESYVDDSMALWPAPQFDFAMESIGDKLKQGAKALKDKLVAFMKKVVEWIKGLFGSRKGKVKAELEANAKTAAKADEAFRIAQEKDPEKAKQAIESLPELKEMGKRAEENANNPAPEREADKVKAEPAPAPNKGANYLLFTNLAPEHIWHRYLFVKAAADAHFLFQEQFAWHVNEILKAIDDKQADEVKKFATDFAGKANVIQMDFDKTGAIKDRDKQFSKTLRAPATLHTLWDSFEALNKIWEKTLQAAEQAYVPHAESTMTQLADKVKGLQGEGDEAILNAVQTLIKVYNHGTTRFGNQLAAELDYARKVMSTKRVGELISEYTNAIGETAPGKEPETKEPAKAPVNSSEGVATESRRQPYWLRTR